MTAPAVRNGDPATSHLAAAAASPGREQIKEIVRLTLASHPDGLTDWQLWEATGLDHSLRGSVIKRRGDLRAVDTGRTALSPSGHPCVVWTLPFSDPAVAPSRGGQTGTGGTRTTASSGATHSTTRSAP